MIKETITYTDFNGNERTEDFYFHLSKAEIMEKEMTTSGGFAELINRVVAAQDTPTIIKIFKELLLESYGVKSPDGKRFIKTPELTAEFEQTPAYSDLFMKLATDDVAAARFVNGIIPDDIAKQLAESGSTHPALK